MFESANGVFLRSMEQASQINESLMQATNSFYSYGFEEYLKALRYNTYLFNKMIEVGVLPTLQSFFELERDITNPLIESARGARTLQDSLKEIGGRVHSGGRYQRLVNTLGRDLFGSATFAGEQRLAENRYTTLSYLPPKPQPGGETPPPLFHVGGFLPYSDQIFRILPEANLFLPFLERGVPVYQMALKGDKRQLGDISGYTIEKVIEMISELSQVAFEHCGQRKMMIEGYCGLAMPMLTYLAARPAEADRRFKVAFTMVAPIDGRKCRMLARMIEKVPQNFFIAQYQLSDLMGGYIDGDSLRMGMDIPLGSYFSKTPFGNFMRGWKKSEYAKVRTISDLTPGQRRELAGAYWISAENCKRFPVPLDQARFTHSLWTNGLNEDLLLPYVYGGRQLGLRAILEQTQIQLAGFYGGKDVVIPHETAHVLQKTMGERYTHVVHPQAGHISYVLSPEIWNPSCEGALDPNPLDLALELFNRK